MNTSFMLNEIQRETLSYTWNTWQKGDSLHLVGMDVGGPILYKYIARIADSVANDIDPTLAELDEWKLFIEKIQFRYLNEEDLNFLVSIKNKICNSENYKSPKYEPIKQAVNHAVMTIRHREFTERNKDKFEIEDFADKAILRDQFMASTAKYFIDHVFPDKKIIISASNYHTARNLENLKEVNEHYNHGIPMGQILYQTYGDDIYSLAISSRKGDFGMIFPKSKIGHFRGYDISKVKGSTHRKEYLAIRSFKTKSSKRDLEWSLTNKGYQSAFIDFINPRKSNTTTAPFYMRPTFTLQPSFKYDWINVYDGVIIANDASYIRVWHIRDLFPSEEAGVNISRLSNYLFSNPK